MVVGKRFHQGSHVHTAPSLQSASSGKRPSHGASHGGHVSPHPSLFGTLEAKIGSVGLVVNLLDMTSKPTQKGMRRH